MTLLNNKINSHGSVIAHQLASSRLLKLQHLKGLSLLKVLCQITLIILVARQLSIMTWQLLSDSTSAEPGVQHIQTQIPTARNKGNTNPLSALDNLQLFGQPPAPQQVHTPVPEDVPVSRLAVRITGLVASSNPEESLVIIRSGSTDSTYHPGDTLKGTRAKVETIYADRVIIRNGEHYESLLMYPDEASKNPVRRPQGDRRNTVAELRQKLQEQPGAWTDIVTISPVRRDGALQGYRVNPARYPEHFARLGLKPNDMAVAINGYDLTDTGEAMKVIGQFSSTSQISLTIERNGQRFQIDLSS